MIDLLLNISDFIILFLDQQLVGGFGIDGITIGRLDSIVDEFPVLLFNQIRQQSLLFFSQGFVLSHHIGATKSFFF